MDNPNSRVNLFLDYLPFRLFFLFSFLFLGLFAGHIFFYQEKSSLFIFSSGYLVENLHQPGSLLLYLGKFLTVFYHYHLAGSLIASLIILFIIILTSRIISFINGKNGGIIPFVAGITLLYLQANYQYMLFNNLGILLQLLFFYLTIKHLKGFIPVIIVPFWYFATGGFAWIFCIMYTSWLVLDGIKKGWIKILLLWSIIVLMIFISGEFLFFQTTRTLIIYPWSKADIGSDTKVFLSLVCILSVLPFIARIRIKIPGRSRLSEIVITISATILMICVLSILAFQRFDRKTNQYFQVEKLFYENKFNEVIDFNIKHPSNNTITAYLNNIALCETGKLNDMLFHFPQSPDGRTLFFKWEITGEILRKGGYFYYTAGMINEAHRWAFEYMVMKGYTPEGIIMLIKTELINGNYQIAAKYISLLKKTIFYREEAGRFEKLMFNNMALDSDPELGVKKKIRVKTDFFSITDDPFINIERIVATDSTNMKAFDYNMAYLLLKKDYQSISNSLPQFNRYGYIKIPVHVEEAAIAYKILNRVSLPYPIKLHIDPSVELRFNQFIQTFQSYGADLKSAEPALKKQFGNTFWYYAFYR
jgi:hypothetical protein